MTTARISSRSWRRFHGPGAVFLLAPFPVTGRPDGQQAGQDPPAGQFGGRGEDGGGGVRGRQGLGHRADGLAAAGGE